VLLVDQMAALALALCDRAYVIEGGRIVAQGSAAEIAADGALGTRLPRRGLSAASAPASARWASGLPGTIAAMRFFKDLSLSAFTAGFVAVLVGFTSSVVIVFQAAQAFGATPEMIASWMWALGLGMGLASVLPSLWLRKPVMIAWSTPGAAVLARPARATAWARRSAPSSSARR
jgi:hypothetical protein